MLDRIKRLVGIRKKTKYGEIPHFKATVGSIRKKENKIELTNIDVKKIIQEQILSTEGLYLPLPNRKHYHEYRYTLTFFNEDKLYKHQAAYLPNRYIRNVTVTHAVNGDILEEGIDYAVWYDGGKIRGLQEYEPFDVLVTFDGYESRYDLIEYDALSNELVVTNGVSRTHDPEEYMPCHSENRHQVYLAYVFAEQCELIPLYQWKGGVYIADEEHDEQLQEHNSRSLNRVLEKLQNGIDIRLAGYGDSITAQGPGTYEYPNGQGRDGLQFYLMLPDDTKSTWTLYDHDDGAGQVHQHFGWNWRLKEKLETEYGVVVNYDNWGIGGTRSGNYQDPNTDRNTNHGGLYPDRINTMLASNPDLVVISFGMNEIGNRVTSANVAEIAKRCQVVGADVIIMGCPRISSLGGRATVEEWRYTNDQLWMAAKETNSAYVSTTLIADDGRLGGIALSPKSMCNSNRFNHPGPYELSKYGKALASLFD